MKGDNDQHEAEVSINFHTLINLEIGLFKHYCFITFLFAKRLVDIVKTGKVCHSKFELPVATQYHYLLGCM